MDSLSVVIFMVLWFVGWFLLAGLALWIVLIIVALTTKDRKYLDKFYEVIKE